MYYAICTSVWCKSPDESFASETLEGALSFCLKRQDRLKESFIVKVIDQTETIVVSFRTIK